MELKQIYRINEIWTVWHCFARHVLCKMFRQHKIRTLLRLLTVAEIPMVSPGTYPPLSKLTLQNTGPLETQDTPTRCSTSNLAGCCTSILHKGQSYSAIIPYNSPTMHFFYKGGGSLRPVFGPKNSKKFLQYLLTIKSQFHPKWTTLIAPIHPEHPLKKWKLQKIRLKNLEKYIHRFLGSLISNPRSVLIHHIRFKVIWRSECKKPDEKIKKKYIYISFWEC